MRNEQNNNLSVTPLSHKSNEFQLSHTPDSCSEKNKLLQESHKLDNSALCSSTTTGIENQNQESIIKRLEMSDNFHSSLDSQVPHTSEDSGMNNSHLLCPHNSHNVDFTTESSQLLDSHGMTLNQHVLVEMIENGFVKLSIEDLDDKHYSNLAEFMECLCDELIKAMLHTCMPAHCEEIIKIKKMLDLPIKVYNHHVTELIESSNKQIQIQYTELINMLNKLSTSRSLCSSIDIDEILKRRQFPEGVGPYSVYNLAQAVRKVNKAPLQSRCTIM